eukprot:scaffold35750_cov65-Attheya_sp.AAC.1
MAAVKQLFNSCLFRVIILLFVILQGTLWWTTYNNLVSMQHVVDNPENVYTFKTVQIPRIPSDVPIDLLPYAMKTEKPKRVLLFDAKETKGQGMGNWMHGLLAAHLLALEFDRIVCATESYFPLFSLGFRQKYHADLCEEEQIKAALLMTNQTSVPQLTLWNYGRPTDECSLAKIMASEDHPVVVLRGNTYHKWPRVPPNFFHWFYEPTEQLQSMIPWKNEESPEIVIHLRKGDGGADSRKGLDEKTLKTLGHQLSGPNKPWLVTNEAALAEEMEQSFGWRGPHWNVAVEHSSLKFTKWSPPRTQTTTTKNNNVISTSISDTDLQALMLWVDWFAIVSAKQVYHTLSDFSSSAIHWMGSDEYILSKILWGTDPHTGDLVDRDEAWVEAHRLEGFRPPRLVDRVNLKNGGCSRRARQRIKKS